MSNKYIICFDTAVVSAVLLMILTAASGQLPDSGNHACDNDAFFLATSEGSIITTNLRLANSATDKPLMLQQSGSGADCGGTIGILGDSICLKPPQSETMPCLILSNSIKFTPELKQSGNTSNMMALSEDAVTLVRQPPANTLLYKLSARGPTKPSELVNVVLMVGTTVGTYTAIMKDGGPRFYLADSSNSNNRCSIVMSVLKCSAETSAGQLDFEFTEGALHGSNGQYVEYNPTSKRLEAKQSSTASILVISKDEFDRFKAQHAGQSGPDAGVIAGAVVGSVAGAAIIGAALYYLMGNRNKTKALEPDIDGCNFSPMPPAAWGQGRYVRMKAFPQAVPDRRPHHAAIAAQHSDVALTIRNNSTTPSRPLSKPSTSQHTTEVDISSNNSITLAIPRTDQQTTTTMQPATSINLPLVSIPLDRSFDAAQPRLDAVHSHSSDTAYLLTNTGAQSTTSADFAINSSHVVPASMPPTQQPTTTQPARMPASDTLNMTVNATMTQPDTVDNHGSDARVIWSSMYNAQPSASAPSPPSAPSAPDVQVDDSAYEAGWSPVELHADMAVLEDKAEALIAALRSNTAAIGGLTSFALEPLGIDTLEDMMLWRDALKHCLFMWLDDYVWRAPGNWSQIDTASAVAMDYRAAWQSYSQNSSSQEAAEVAEHMAVMLKLVQEGSQAAEALGGSAAATLQQLVHSAMAAWLRVKGCRAHFQISVSGIRVGRAPKSLDQGTRHEVQRAVQNQPPFESVALEASNVAHVLFTCRPGVHTKQRQQQAVVYESIVAAITS